MLWRSSSLFCILSLMLLLAVTGCGGDALNRGSVGGKVTLDGTPVAQGTVIFTPVDGTKGPIAMAQIVNGEYSIDKDAPVVGKHLVKIQGFRDTDKKDELGRVVGEQFIPAKYNDNTTLKVDIAQGENACDFPLTSQ